MISCLLDVYKHEGASLLSSFSFHSEMQKLLALKKAYADIILGISKEAAARVLASEKKSARYQYELKVAKEDGLQMLLRLKKMMDSQVKHLNEF